MRKTILSGTGLVVTMVALAALTGCSSSSNDSGSTGPTTPGADGGAGSDGGSTPDGSGDGGTTALPQPVFCPETNPFSPTLPNSVVVSDVVLAQDTTWTADKVYLVGDDFKIEHHTLTVEAGTTICLYQTGKILVGQGIDPGEIHLDGTADKPITITTTASTNDPTKPDTFHEGLLFDTYEGSSLSYVNIWYGGVGGGSSSWAFEMTDTAQGNDPTKPLLVDHLTVGAVQTKGIRIGPEVGIADGSNIQFTGFMTPDSDTPTLDAALEVQLHATTSVAKAINLAGASIPAAAQHANLLVEGADGSVSSNADLVDFGLPYLYKNAMVMAIAGAQNDPVGATLTIHEGVTLKMDGALVIGGLSGTAEGNLVIAGTTAKPVILTSTSDTPASGDWEGLYFVGGQFDPTRSKIDNAQILYAGVDSSDGLQINYQVGRCGDDFVGAVMIDGVGGAYAGPEMSNVTIAHSKSDGIVSAASNTGDSMATSYARPDITFQDIAGKATDDNGTCQ